jgi:hydrogenase maturation protein HypF
VGFRPWVYRIAREEGIQGRVRNDVGGVTIEAFGGPAALHAFLRRIGTEAPPAASVREIEEAPIPAETVSGFAIVPSEADGARRVSIPPDLATCPECLGEVHDARDRRHLYPFTNCTHCGPRYTIAREVPYDRTSTTMAGFAMCADCQREYEDPGDRRFHAQPVACPACGPRVSLKDAAGRKVLGEGEAIHAAAAELRRGRIVAV